MNLLEELRNLDFNDIGRWPLPVHAFFIGVFFLLASIGGFWYFVYQKQMPELEQARAEENKLKLTFEEKQKKAANFSAYQAQLAEIERSFGTMLRQLPGKTEIPNLLVDISQTGLGAGLQEQLFQPLEENRKDFYAEKPIKIRLTGSYHELGRFVSDIAALPRIVTLHDIEITPEGKDPAFDDLVLNVTAKTYRYLDEDELEAAEATPDGQNKGPKRATRPNKAAAATAARAKATEG